MAALKSNLYLYHSKEFKLRFFYLVLTGIISFIIAFLNMEFLLYKLIPTGPLLPTFQKPLDFIFTEISEAFFSYLLLAGYFSFFLTLPIIYYHIYCFLISGLTYTESFILKVFAYGSLFFYYLAHILTYIIIVPYATSFFLTFQSNTPIDFLQQTIEHSFDKDTLTATFTPHLNFLGRIYPWITFLINLFTIVSFLFQLPLVIFLLFLYLFNLYKNKIESNNIHDTTFFKLNFFQNTTLFRKVLFFTLLLFTAIFSPPDLYSQIFLFIPLFIIIECFLFFILLYFEYLKLTKK